MPNKTIYVSESDAALFSRAQELVGGNLSDAISQALRRFVEVQEAHMIGYEEVDVRVGEAGVYKHRRFIGRLLAQYRVPADATGREQYIVVYQTQKGRYAVHSKRYQMPSANFDYAALASEAGWYRSSDWQNIGQYRGENWNAWGSAELELVVHDELDSLLAALPAPLAAIVTANLEKPPVEVLDI